MSTRTRILLYYKEKPYTYGPRAVLMLLQYAFPDASLLKGLLKKKFIGCSKIEKLLKLADKLPVNFELKLIQEPRGTRKNRSLYWGLKHKQEVFEL